MSSSDVDRLIDEVVAAGAAALPGRIVAWYVTGSYADGSAVPGSDLDIVAVLDGEVGLDEDAALRRSRHGLGEPYGIFVDISARGLVSLRSNGDVAISLRSRIVAGTDIRSQLRATDMASFRRQMMHAPFLFSTRIRETTELHCPLAAPDPTMPFLGYEVCRFLPVGHHDRDTLKDMVAMGCFIATALVALETDQPTTSKSEAVEKYQELRLGPWNELLKALVEVIRGRWNWRIPQGSEDREYLLAQCHRLLEFENEFYDTYAAFLRSERKASQRGAREYALNRIARFHHPDVAD